ncbi:MAG: hypothetical protein V1662_06430 [Candidatus Omnitrophota bacterium]
MMGNRFELRKRRKHFLSLTGFTFIELILVAVVILVLLGMGTPLFRGAFTGVQLQDSCQRLVQLMRWTQAKSITERRVYRVNFDFEKGAFWLTAQDSQDNKKFSRITGRWAKTNKLPEGITVEGEDAILTFYPDGTADKESIRLCDQQGNGFTITAKRRIGYVQIKK